VHDDAAPGGYDPKAVMGLLQKVTASQPLFGGSGADCDDGLDNEGDGLVDYPADPDCGSALGSSEGDPPSAGGAGGEGGGGGGGGGATAPPADDGCACAAVGADASVPAAGDPGGAAALLMAAAAAASRRRRRRRASGCWDAPWCGPDR